VNDEEEKKPHRGEEIPEGQTTHSAAVAGGGRRRGSAAGGLAGKSFPDLSLSKIWCFVEKMKENGRLGVYIPRPFNWGFRPSYVRTAYTDSAPIRVFVSG
jgi:hypothetical protein